MKYQMLVTIQQLKRRALKERIGYTPVSFVSA